LAPPPSSPADGKTAVAEGKKDAPAIKRSPFRRPIGTGFEVPQKTVVPAKAMQAVDAKREELQSGKWDVFMGPIKDQSGAVKIAAAASDRTKLRTRLFMVIIPFGMKATQ